MQTLPCRLGDPDLWFAESPGDVEAAKAQCRDCPLQPECLAGALERREPWGSGAASCSSQASSWPASGRGAVRGRTRCPSRSRHDRLGGAGPVNEGPGPDQPGSPGWSDRLFHAVRLWLGRALW